MRVRRTLASLSVCLLFWPLIVIAEENSSTLEESQPPQTVADYKDVMGRVVDDETGTPVAGVPVSLLYETTVTDSDGRFLFEKISINHMSRVSLRIRSKMGVIIGCMTLDVPARFYPLAASTEDKIAVEIVRPDLGIETELRLKSVPQSAVDDYCVQCHGLNPRLETVSYKDVLKTKTDMRGIVVDEDKIESFTSKAAKQGFNEKTYKVMRYQDTHPKKINLYEICNSNDPNYKGQYQMPPTLTLLTVTDAKGTTKSETEAGEAAGEKSTDETGRLLPTNPSVIMVSCDTCHTRHIPTGQKYYIAMPYEEDNGLCLQCHL